MKMSALILFLLSLAGAGGAAPVAPAATSSAPSSSASGRPSGRDVIVLAHRGCWADGAPEVSIAAIRACGPVGAQAVEIDVQKTRDGVLVLMHDESVDRTTNGTGRVADMTLAQIHALRLRAGAGGEGAALTDERVPTLEEALLAAKGRFIVVLDMKGPLEEDVTRLVSGLDMGDKLWMWKNYRKRADAVQETEAQKHIRKIPILFECGQNPAPACWNASSDRLTDYAALRPVAFYPIHEGLDFLGRIAAQERPEGALILARTLWTENEKSADQRREEWRAMVDMGVDIIMTDRPKELIEIIK